LLGRAEQSNLKAAQRRAEGAGLDSKGADRANMRSAAMQVIFVFEVGLFTTSQKRAKTILPA
jgi:hypothetical protein